MGNKIKNIDQIKMNGHVYNIELNGGTKKEKYDIHIQNKDINICMKDFEFASFATAILVANKRMKRFKKKYE